MTLACSVGMRSVGMSSMGVHCGHAKHATFFYGIKLIFDAHFLKNAI
jgi:hypothetical protein